MANVMVSFEYLRKKKGYTSHYKQRIRPIVKVVDIKIVNCGIIHFDIIINILW